MAFARCGYPLRFPVAMSDLLVRGHTCENKHGFSADGREKVWLEFIETTEVRLAEIDVWTQVRT